MYKVQYYTLQTTSDLICSIMLSRKTLSVQSLTILACIVCLCLVSWSATCPLSLLLPLWLASAWCPSASSSCERKCSTAPSPGTASAHHAHDELHHRIILFGTSTSTRYVFPLWVDRYLPPLEKSSVQL